MPPPGSPDTRVTAPPTIRDTRVTVCPPHHRSHRGIPGKKCGTIILLAEELGNCRVSGPRGGGGSLGTPLLCHLGEWGGGRAPRPCLGPSSTLLWGEDGGRSPPPPHPGCSRWDPEVRGGGFRGGDTPSPQDVATLQFCANKLDKKDFFGKSDPFMVFYRSNEDGT